MLKELVKVANRLDYLGLQKEADIIDSFLKKEATRVVGADTWLQNFVDIMEGIYNYEFDGDILIAKDGDTIPTPENKEEAREILLNLGMNDVEILDVLFSDLEIYPEPPVNPKDVKAAFVNQFMNSRNLLTLEVESIEWDNEPSEYPHYNVKSLGTYESSRTGSVEDYRIDTDFMLQDWGEPVEGSDGKTYYFYGED
jgi:hypothetical protein